MEGEKVNTLYFEQEVDKRENFTEKCLATLVIVLAEIRDQLTLVDFNVSLKDKADDAG